MTWFTAQQVTVSNGSTTVVVNSNENISNIRPGDALIIGSFDPVEVLKAYTDTGGVNTISLVLAWPNSTQTTQPAKVMPIAGDFKAATEALRNSTIITSNNFKANEEWGTLFGTITYTAADGISTYTARTLQQMDLDVASIENTANGLVGNISATRWQDFERDREATRNKFVSSGVVEFGRERVGYTSISQGLWASNATAGTENYLYWGQTINGSQKSGASYVGNPIININGAIIKVEGIGNTSLEYNKLILPPAPSGSYEASTTTTSDYSRGDFVIVGNDVYICTDDSLTGVLTTNTTYFSTIEACCRSDLVGLECFLAPISGTDRRPFYPKGMVQGKSTAYSGITLAATSTLGIPGVTQTYCSAYQGDTTDGFGVDFDSLSQSQQNSIIYDKDNNVLVKDGAFYQWQCRQRSIRGLGTSWENIQTWDALRYDSTRHVKPQGILNQAPELDTYNDSIGYYSDGILPLSNSYQGVFIASNSGGTATNPIVGVEGQCYFLPLALVTRLNDGLYHPFLNSLGCSRKVDATFSEGVKWYETSLHDTTTNNTSECFINTVSGTISEGNPARPDGALYDVIYPWQVLDLRKSSRGVTQTPNQALDSLIDLSHKGWEPLPILHVTNKSVTVSAAAVSTAADTFEFSVSAADNPLGQTTIELDVDATHFTLQGDNGESMRIKVLDSTDPKLAWPSSANLGIVYGANALTEFNSKFPVGTKIWAAAESKSNIYLADHMTTDVVTKVADGYTTMQSYGVTSTLGMRLINTVPDGTSRTEKAIRKVVDYQARTYSDDQGATWASDLVLQSNYEGPDNGVTKTHTVGTFTMYTYSTPAYSLQPDTYLSVASSFSEVYAFNSSEPNWGAVLCCNLTDNVPTNNSMAPVLLQGAGLYNYCITPDGQVPIQTSAYAPEHSPVTLGTSSDGVKCFSYMHDDSEGLRWLVIVSKELKHNGSSWGDDNKFNFVDNVSKIPDENGLTISVSCQKVWLGYSPRKENK